MPKTKIVITHEEYGEYDLGDIPPQMFAEFLKQERRDWSLSDLGADWRQIKVEVDGKEY